MYQFTAVALLGLVALKVTGLVEELVPGIARFRNLFMFAMSVGAVIALDYSLFAGFGIALREAWMGPLVTGLIVASAASAWQSVLAYLGSVRAERSYTNPAERPRIAA